MQALLILLICLVTLAILAGRYGVDPRDGLDWSPPDPARSRGRLQRAVLADQGCGPLPGRSRLWTYLPDLKCDRPDGSHPVMQTVNRVVMIGLPPDLSWQSIEATLRTAAP
jgi:hypothetical protein